MKWTLTVEQSFELYEGINLLGARTISPLRISYNVCLLVP